MASMEISMTRARVDLDDPRGDLIVGARTYGDLDEMRVHVDVGGRYVEVRGSHDEVVVLLDTVAAIARRERDLYRRVLAARAERERDPMFEVVGEAVADLRTPAQLGDDPDVQLRAIRHGEPPRGDRPGDPARHRAEGYADRCACGGAIVYFEDGDERGDVGEGCEVAGLTWENALDAEHEDEAIAIDERMMRWAR